MSETFITANTKIEDLLTKKESIMDIAANLVTEATIERAKNNKVSANTERDISNLIKGFDNEEQVEILKKAIVKLAMNGNFGNGGNSYDEDDDFYSGKKSSKRSDIFRRR